MKPRSASFQPLRVTITSGENPATSEADMDHAVHLLEGLDTLIVQDLVMTKTAELADRLA